MRYGSAETTLGIRPNWESIEISTRCAHRRNLDIHFPQTNVFRYRNLFRAHSSFSLPHSLSLTPSCCSSISDWSRGLTRIAWPSQSEQKYSLAFSARRMTHFILRSVWQRIIMDILQYPFCINRQSFYKALNFWPTFYFKASTKKSVTYTYISIIPCIKLVYNAHISYNVIYNNIKIKHYVKLYVKNFCEFYSI